LKHNLITKNVLASSNIFNQDVDPLQLLDVNNILSTAQNA